MKILYCLAGTYNSGGMERIIAEKANWLSMKGFEVTIVTTEQKARPNYYALNKDIKCIDLGICYSDVVITNPLTKFSIRRKKLRKHKKGLQEIINQIKPDVIISTFGNEIGIIPKIRTTAKRVAEIHFSRWYRLQLNRKGIWKYIDRFLTYNDLKLIKKYDQFVTLTFEDRNNWPQYSNISVIPNFIETHERPAILNNKIMISIGRLSYQKGYDRLILAWKRVSLKYPDWKLKIYGGGEEYDNIQRLIISHNLSKFIELCPPTKQIDEVYQNASALILSSRYEGLPMVLLEAMSNGVPPIAYSCQCGPKDIIKSGHNGILVKEGDINGLTTAIIQVMSDERLRKELGKNAYSRSFDYRKENVMQLWEQLFNDLLSQ